ncbi:MULTISPECIES: alpha/beta hydrolase [unclassified Streptomyces]|uniref:alpha/beta hydrolase n=1 Tax=unclassified Streptomyces TaxID=2593676 RepID=UPI00381BBC78
MDTPEAGPEPAAGPAAAVPAPGAPPSGAPPFERHAYGSHGEQYGELFRPAGRPRGVAVVLHGGFWRARYAAPLARPLARDLAEHGWAAWNVEYRRVGNGGGGLTTLDDVSAAVDHLAELDGLDLSTVIAVGHSAGGHLAAFAAGRRAHPRWADSRVAITGVIAQAAVLDLAAARAAGLGDGAVDAFLGGPGAPVPAGADPSARLPLPVPVWCVHAWDDEDVPVDQSLAYVRRARAAGGRAGLVALDGDHFTVVDPLSVAWSVTRRIMTSLVSDRAGP